MCSHPYGQSGPSALTALAGSPKKCGFVPSRTALFSPIGFGNVLTLTKYSCRRKSRASAGFLEEKMDTCIDCKHGLFSIYREGSCRHPNVDEHATVMDDCCSGFEADDPEKLKDFETLREYLRARGAGLFSRLHDYTYQSPPVTPSPPHQLKPASMLV
jgi:hypothetical protein